MQKIQVLTVAVKVGFLLAMGAMAYRFVSDLGWVKGSIVSAVSLLIYWLTQVIVRKVLARFEVDEEAETLETIVHGRRYVNKPYGMAGSVTARRK